MNYAAISKNDIANGTGVRIVLWCSGCKLNCPGCHNKEVQDFNYGKSFTEDTLNYLIELLDKPYVSGLTLSGGHPLEKENLAEINHIIDVVNEKFPLKNIWLYSGYTYEYIKDHKELLDTVRKVDVLVDGPYIEAERDITIPFRGSKNQRIIYNPGV